MHITPQQQQPIPAEGVHEEKIEYRDEDGNLLDEDQVRALEGKISFSTRYETRTRLVDEAGNEVWEGEAEFEGVEGTLAEGVDPVSARDVPGEGEGKTPGKVPVRGDLERERSLENERATAEPESEVGKETGKDEL